MKRKIIRIDEEACNGCGLCASACHEGAIGIVGGKARLLREDYCDGLGDCLPACPAGAITFEEREAAAYDAEAVRQKKEQQNARTAGEACSRLGQWPVQIKLTPVQAPFFQGAKLLVAADCAAYAYASFHEDFMRGKVTLIGCPKLDMVDYTEKLTAILQSNDITALTIVRMEVPCCGGIQHAATQALRASGKFIPWQVVTISTDGRILD